MKRYCFLLTFIAVPTCLFGMETKEDKKQSKPNLLAQSVIVPGDKSRSIPTTQPQEIPQKKSWLGWGDSQSLSDSQNSDSKSPVKTSELATSPQNDTVKKTIKNSPATSSQEWMFVRAWNATFSTKRDIALAQVKSLTEKPSEKEIKLISNKMGWGIDEILSNSSKIRTSLNEKDEDSLLKLIRAMRTDNKDIALIMKAAIVNMLEIQEFDLNRCIEHLRLCRDEILTQHQSSTKELQQYLQQDKALIDMLYGAKREKETGRTIEKPVQDDFNDLHLGKYYLTNDNRYRMLSEDDAKIFALNDQKRQSVVEEQIKTGSMFEFEITDALAKINHIRTTQDASSQEQLRAKIEKIKPYTRSLLGMINDAQENKTQIKELLLSQIYQHLALSKIENLNLQRMAIKEAQQNLKKEKAFRQTVYKAKFVKDIDEPSDDEYDDASMSSHYLGDDYKVANKSDWQELTKKATECDKALHVANTIKSQLTTAEAKIKELEANKKTI